MSQPLSLSKHNVIFELPVAGRRAQESLEIRNVEGTPILYKILTSGRGRYIVKNSSGRLEPFASTKIEILLSLPDSDLKLPGISDKFAVYSLAANIDTTDKKELDAYIDANRKNAQKTVFTTSVIVQEERESLYRSEAPLKNSVVGLARTFSENNDLFDSTEFQTVASKISVDVPPVSLRKNPILSEMNFKKTLSTPAIVNPFDEPKIRPVESSVAQTLKSSALGGQSRDKDAERDKQAEQQKKDGEAVVRLQQQNSLLESELKLIRVR